MAGLKISELTQPSLSSDKNVRLTDLLPIARASLTGEDTFALPGVAFTTNLASVGSGNTLIGTKTFNPNSGNSYPVKTLSANAPIVISDNGNTITLDLSGTISDAIAGLTPIKAKFVGTGSQTFFTLPNVPLPTDASAYRVDTNGVVQEPNVDYTIITDTTPYQIRFVTAPILNEKVVVVAFAPSIVGSDTSLTPIKFTRTGTGSVSAFNLSLVNLPTDPTAYRVDIGGLVKDPNVDYFIDASVSPYQIKFFDPPANGQKIVIVAFAPAVNSTAYATPVLEANSVLANPTNFNNVTSTSLPVPGNNSFVGNTGTGLAAITLSAAGGLTLNTSLRTNTVILSAPPVDVTRQYVDSLLVGMVAPFATNSAPAGWLQCNGDTIPNGNGTVQGKTANFSALYALLQNTHGAFGQLPDLRGYFVRGSGTNNDTTVGGNVGVKQADTFKSHTHAGSTASAGSHAHTGSTASAGSHTHGGTAASAGSHTHSGTATSAGSHTHSYGDSTSTDPIRFGFGSAAEAVRSPYDNQRTTGAAGDHTHSLTINAAGDHTHSILTGSAGDHTHSVTIDSAGAHTHSVTIDATGDVVETRPKNIPLLYCIKF